MKHQISTSYFGISIRPFYLLLEPGGLWYQTLTNVGAQKEKNMYRHTEIKLSRSDEGALTLRPCVRVCVIIFFHVCISHEGEQLLSLTEDILQSQNSGSSAPDLSSITPLWTLTPWSPWSGSLGVQHDGRASQLHRPPLLSQLPPPQTIVCYRLTDRDTLILLIVHFRRLCARGRKLSAESGQFPFTKMIFCWWIYANN